MAASQRYLKLLQFLEVSSSTVPTIEQAWELLQQDYRTKKVGVRNTVWVCASTACKLLQEQKYNANLFEDMKDLHIRKNAGYSGLHEDPFYNFRQVEKFGISTQDGIIARLTDKYQRYINVKANPELDKVQESFTDTLTDMISYCLILYCVMEEDAATAKEKEI